MLRSFFVALAACSLVCAADPYIDSLRALLSPMRGEESHRVEVRGATPALTQAKHQLRDWIEARLKPLGEREDPSALEDTLNSELHAAGLVVGVRRIFDDPEWWQLGYLSNLELRRSGAFLTVVTRVGIMCGFDDSAYVYGWSETNGWHRTFQNEQNNFSSEESYQPQNIVSVQVSSLSRSNDYLVLTLGTFPWCSSVWQPIYYRVFRPGADPEPKPLIDGKDMGFVSEPVEGTVDAH